jgi:hypothetical protein
MNSCSTIYIVNDNGINNLGMIFNPEGDFSYAIDINNNQDYLKNNRNKYCIINPKEKAIFRDIQEKKSIEIIGKYFNRIFKEDSPIIDSKNIFSNIFSSVIQKYSFDNKSVLDYGCGNKKYSSFFSNSNYVGYDINDKDNISSLSENAFDYILFNFVLEHSADPYETLNKAFPFLKKNGIFIISIPALTISEFIRYYCLNFNLHLPLFHLRTFSISDFKGCVSTLSLLKYLIKHGFKINNIFGINSYRNKIRIYKNRPFCFFGKQIILICEKLF